MDYTLSSTSINASVDSLYIPKKSPLTKDIFITKKPQVTVTKSYRRNERTVDNGYAYVVLLSCTVGFFLITALVSCNAIIYQQLLLKFGLSATATGWMVSLQSAVRLLSSPVVRVIYTQCTYRTVATMSGLCYTLGIVLTAYASEPWVVYLGFGVLSGIGSNMFIMSSFILLSEYFDKRRGKAMGIAYMGCGIAGVAFPPIITACFESYGYTQSMMILCGVLAQLCISGALYRPQPPLTPTLTGFSTVDIEDKKCSSDLKLLINGQYMSYILIMTSLIGLNFTGNVFVASLGQEIAGLSNVQNATVLSIGSFCQMFAQFLLGLFFDIPVIRQYRMFLFSLLSALFGIACICLAFCTDFISFAVLWVLFQVISYSAHPQHITVLGDILSVDELPGGIALCRTVMGVGVFGITTVVGGFSDYAGSQAIAFFYLGVFHTLLTILCTIICVCLKWHSYKLTKQEVNGGHVKGIY